ncbi:ribonuclease E/G [Georhizobium profundi]|uniref:Ribonuclease E n=1 Tax=Georhizobium profundi TaxID=2341112 RepID=A0A3S9B5G5_9HYPH|nr:ribonuclease E/G [Georhizobium profundi]AZN72166.1 ribonuclease E/G [Georhizobium profundi]
MADKMLIDASHKEETRVVVVRGSRIEEFDFESQHKKQLRGNIYLAKVTRVEPSLQAAFVDYGGNRHGFLAFSEIHPDYYQIPLADRQALLAAEAEAEAERARHENEADEAADRAAASATADDASEDIGDSDGDDDAAPARKSKRGRRRGRKADAETDAVEDAVEDLDGGSSAISGDDDSDDGESDGRSMAAIVETESVSEAVENDDDGERDPGEVDFEAAKFVEGKAADSNLDLRNAVTESDDDEDEEDDQAGSDDESEGDGNGERDGKRRRGRRNQARRGGDDQEEEAGGRVESVGAEDALEELPDRSVRKPRKQYRIQEVIKRRQILLVQVVKEERGNKGAALTTYLSLAGRYSVLMPNTARGGGISRKITNAQDRKRLKEVARGLEVPQGMGVILRTAGANRTKAEVKRDFEYLMRLWENVRNLTLASTAPCLVYEEGSLIKRSIRDLYNKDISEIIVSGEDGYREAKDFMKMLMPSHAKVVQPYREVHPIFSRSGIEAQLDRMLQPQVTLKSGGYIIINQTEALVAIDVNSGRSTREHSIEDTALQTNLEAADEVARQLRLRDLAGLIVVDFIDMEEKRNNRSVEKRLKDALKNDRARIQVGRISHFGLLEMSRQRIRASVLESTTQVCDHCGGTGHVRSQSSVALHVIRSIEEFLLKSTTHDLIVRTMPATAIYVLNQKRQSIVEMERRFGVSITIDADASIGSAHLAIDRGAPVENPVRIETIMPLANYDDDDDGVAGPVWDEEEEDADVVEAPVEARAETRSETRVENGENGDRKKRRRRRRRGGRDRDDENGAVAAETGSTETDEDDDDAADNVESGSEVQATDDDGRPRKRRRRGKRGGRRNRQGEDGQELNASEGDASGEETSAGHEVGDNEPAQADQDAADAVEGAVVETVELTAAKADAEPAPVVSEEAVAAPAEDEAAASEEKPKRRRATRKKADAVEADADAEPAKPARKPRAKKAAKAEPAEDVSAVAAEPETQEAAPAVAEEVAAEAVQESAPVVAEPEAEAPVEPTKPAEPQLVSNGQKAEPEGEAKPKKGGWWQRRGFF